MAQAFYAVGKEFGPRLGTCAFVTVVLHGELRRLFIQSGCESRNCLMSFFCLDGPDSISKMRKVLLCIRAVHELVADLRHTEEYMMKTNALE